MATLNDLIAQLKATSTAIYAFELEGKGQGMDIALRKSIRSAGFACMAQASKLANLAGAPFLTTPSELRASLAPPKEIKPTKADKATKTA